MPAVKLTLEANFKAASQQIAEAMKATDAHITKVKNSMEKLDTKSLGEIISKSRLMGAGMTATRGPMEGLLSRQRMLSREIEKYIRQGLDPQSDKLREARTEFEAVATSIRKMKDEQKAAAEATAKLKKATEEQAQAMKDATDTAATYAKYGLMALFTATTLLAGGMLRNSAMIEDAEAAFRPMLGSLEKAKVLVDMINETAAKTPFQFEDISMAVKQLLPAVRGNMGEVIKTFRMLGDVSSGNAQRLDSVTRAYTKSMLRGRVDMRSLNMIARAGVPIFSELSKSMSVTTEQLFTMSKKGQISSAALVKAFETMTSKGGMFFRGMEIASLTLTGRISTLKDNIILLSANIGNALLPYAKEFVEVSLSMVGGLRNITNDSVVARAALDAMAFSILMATTALVTFLAVVKGSAALAYMATMASGLWAVLAANPLGVLLGSLVALNVAIWTAGQRMGNLKFVMKTEMEAAWDMIVGTSQVRKLELEKVYSQLGLSISKVFSHTIKYAAEGALKGIMSRFTWLINKMRDVAGIAPDATLVAVNKLWDASLKRRETASAESYKKDAKNIEDTYTKLITNQLAATFKAQAAIKSRLKDAKLAAGAFGGGTNAAEGGEGSLYEKLMSLQKPEESTKQNLRTDVSTFKAWMKERMEFLEIAKGQETKFLRDENARYQAMSALNAEEKLASEKASQELITEIAAKGSKARIKNIEKEQQQTFDMLLKNAAGDVQLRRWQQERESFKTHLDDRMKTLQIAAVDESTFLQAEGERLQSLKNLTDSQKLRAEEVVNARLMEIHEKHLAEMEKIDKKAADKLAKDKAKADAEILLRQRLIEGESNRNRTVTTRNADMVRSAIQGMTEMFTNAAMAGKLAFKDMANSILGDIYRIMINRIVTDFITSIFPMSRTQRAGAPSYADISPTADARVDYNSIPKNAMGNYASKATLGIYGEKGPEAIMPLVRRNGVLGVGAPSGGNATVMNVQIIDQSSGKKEYSQQRSPSGKELMIMIKDATSMNLRTGAHDKDFDAIGVPRRRSYA